MLSANIVSRLFLFEEVHTKNEEHLGVILGNSVPTFDVEDDHSFLSGTRKKVDFQSRADRCRFVPSGSTSKVRSNVDRDFISATVPPLQRVGRVFPPFYSRVPT